MAFLGKIHLDGFPVAFFDFAEGIVWQIDKGDSDGCVGLIRGLENADTLEWLNGFVLFLCDQVNPTIFFAKLLGKRLAA